MGTQPAAAWKHSGFQAPGTAQCCCSTSLTCISPWQGFPRHRTVFHGSFLPLLAPLTALCFVMLA